LRKGRGILWANQLPMAFPKRFEIKEDMATLRKALRGCKNEMISKRLRALIVFKEHEGTGISKGEVAARIGVDHGSAVKWRNAYINGGLAGMLSHGKKGNRPSVIEPHQREMLRVKLHDPQNGLRGYTELVSWFNAHFGAQVKYKTLNQFVNRNFGASCKTARKSHVKKDAQAVEALKKTSRASASS
jgi:transposase